MSRSARNMIAELGDGQEVSWRTASQRYDWAGIVLRPDGKLERAAVGYSKKSVAKRTFTEIRREYPWVSPDTIGRFGAVVAVTEETAPMLREYFGTHHVYVTQVFTESGGWQGKGLLNAGKSDLRRMAREGITHVWVKSPGLTVPAEFSIAELVRDMNKRIR